MDDQTGVEMTPRSGVEWSLHPSRQGKGGGGHKVYFPIRNKSGMHPRFIQMPPPPFSQFQWSIGEYREISAEMEVYK